MPLMNDFETKISTLLSLPLFTHSHRGIFVAYRD